jgi:hypothetical protein
LTILPNLHYTVCQQSSVGKADGVDEMLTHAMYATILDMHVEVDQSGKIEDTATDTVLAFSNGKSYAICIPAQVKRECLLTLRTVKGSGKRLYWRLFAVGLFLLLKGHSQQLSLVTIDIEYIGHMHKIKQHVLNLFAQAGKPMDPDRLRFGLIHRGGRVPAAHDKAYRVHKGVEKADMVMTINGLLKYIH